MIDSEKTAAALRGRDLAESLVLRALLMSVARLANPQDPRQFVHEVMLECQRVLPADGALFEDLSPSENDVARFACMETLSDFENRMGF